MKLAKTPRKPVDADTDLWYRQVAQQVNGLSEGLISASYNARSSIPTVAGQVGDFVKNSNPSELGTTPNKYILAGWMYLSTGWTPCRFLTGN